MKNIEKQTVYLLNNTAILINYVAFNNDIMQDCIKLNV